jgi:hypothetical protein
LCKCRAQKKPDRRYKAGQAEHKSSNHRTPQNRRHQRQPTPQNLREV